MQPNSTSSGTENNLASQRASSPWKEPKITKEYLSKNFHRGDQPIHPLIQALLNLRNIDLQKEKDFFQPRLRSLSDPFLLPEMTQAIKRLEQAISQNEAILLYGDYDVDGLTSLTITHKALQAMGVEVYSFIPRRIEEGYGLTQAGLERALKEFATHNKAHTKPTLLLALDCGTNSAELLDDLKSQGIESIIVDHHQLTSKRPNCQALVNPQLGDNQELKTLCTAALAFKLFHALLKKHPQLAPPDFDLRNFLDLVALGIIADVCPLKGENRLLVYHGLRRLSNSTHPGLVQLTKLCDLSSIPSAVDVSFRVSPRLNAAGRLNRAVDALKLLLCDEEQTARELAHMLDECNRKRQQIQLKVEEEAEEELAKLSTDAPIIILAHSNWHPGVVGIVAGKLCRRYARPAFVLAIDENGIAHGSGRSIGEISLAAGLEATQEFIISGGGHAAAAGVSLKKENLSAFREAFSQWLLNEGLDETQDSTQQADIELPLELCDQELLEQWPLLEPFGHGFTQPLFLIRNCHPVNEPRWLKEKHLKIQLQGADHPLDALWFNASDTIEELPPPPWDILAQLSINEFRGTRSIQLYIQHLR